MGAAVGPVAQPAISVVTPITTPVIGAVKPIVQPVLTVANPVVRPIVGAVTPIIEPVVDVLSPVIGSVIGVTIPVTGSITGVITPVVPPIAGEPIDPAVPTLPDAADPLSPPVLGADSPVTRTVIGTVMLERLSHPSVLGPVGRTIRPPTDCPFESRPVPGHEHHVTARRDRQAGLRVGEPAALVCLVDERKRHFREVVDLSHHRPLALLVDCVDDLLPRLDLLRKLDEIHVHRKGDSNRVSTFGLPGLLAHGMNLPQLLGCVRYSPMSRFT